MRSIDDVHSQRERERSRKLRGTLIYSATVLVSGAVVVALFWWLRVLILPILAGTLLAYLFRPIKQRLNVPFVSSEIQIFVFLAVVTAGLVYMGRTIENSIPSDREKLELRVRMQFKLNERFESAMGIDPKTGRGNVVYNLLANDLNPIMASVNKVLTLSAEEEIEFKKYAKSEDEEEMVDPRYYDYFLVNKKRTKTAAAIAAAAAAAERRPDSVSKSKGEAVEPEHHVSILKTLSNWIVMPLVFIFLLLDNGAIIRYFYGFVPNRYFELTLTMMNEFDEAIGKYLRGTAMECALVGVSTAIGMYIVGIQLQMAVLIGVISGIINAVPFLGPMIGAVIGVAYSLIAENVTPLIPMDPSNLIFGVIAVVTIVHILDNIIFQPLVLGSAVNLHPLAVILGILGGSVMAGVLGMLFAIPVIVIFKVISETLFKELKAYKII